MKDLIRTVVVDPHPESRDALRRLLGSIGAFWVAEVLETYRESPARIDAINPDLTIVVLDHDPQCAIESIAALTQANPRAIVLPASRTSDSSLILLRDPIRERVSFSLCPANRPSFSRSPAGCSGTAAIPSRTLREIAASSR